MYKIFDKYKVIVLVVDRYLVNLFIDIFVLLIRLCWLGIDGGSLMLNIFEKVLCVWNVLSCFE